MFLSCNEFINNKLAAKIIRQLQGMFLCQISFAAAILVVASQNASLLRWWGETMHVDP